MDDLLPRIDAPRPCAPGLAPHRDPELPADFVPLRLLLQPGGLCVDLTRPDMLLGRHSGADVRLSLADISRRHCRFLFSDGAWQVFDLQSLNGVFVNGEKLHEAIIHHGDRIRIGSLTFEAALGEGSDQTIGGPSRPAVQTPMRKAS